jgi:predicted small secreted protein
MTMRGMALVLGVLLAGAGGCNTWRGFGKDVQGLGRRMEGKNQAVVNGPRGRQMTISVPRAVSVQRGQIRVLEVGIKRNFDNPVRLGVAGLPPGVLADEPEGPVDGDKGVMLLRASPTAELTAGHTFQVIAAGPDGMKAIVSAKLNVEE